MYKIRTDPAARQGQNGNRGDCDGTNSGRKDSFCQVFFSLLPSLNILVSFWPVREINPQKIGRLIQLARRLVCGWEVFRPFSVDSVSVMVRPKERKTKEIPLRGTLVGLGSLLPTTATAQQPDDDDADGM